jgi:hypothetical protein
VVEWKMAEDVSRRRAELERERAVSAKETIQRSLGNRLPERREPGIA